MLLAEDGNHGFGVESTENVGGVFGACTGFGDEVGEESDIDPSGFFVAVEEGDAPPISKGREQSSTPEGGDRLEESILVVDDAVVIRLGAVLDDVVSDLFLGWAVL